MASEYKVLGQARPADTNVADLYTVPTGGQAIASTIAVANTTALNATYRIFIRPDAATADEGTAIVYDAVIAGNSTTTLTLGITANGDDVVSVKSNTALALTFTAFGLEIS
jgi:hypothetical protein